MFSASENKDFKLLYEGAYLEDVLKIIPLSLLHKLRMHEFILIDPTGRIYLTFKGKIAKKIGLHRYIELERLERKTLNYNRKNLLIWNVLLFLSCIGIILILLSLLKI